MKQFVRAGILATLVFGLAGSTAMANTITVTPTPIIAGPLGNVSWQYAVVLTGDSTVNTGDFFTIFDFAGLIGPSVGNPAGWAFSSANVGVCPADVVAICNIIDDPAVTNVTFTRTGAPIPNLGGTTNLGPFTILSMFNEDRNDWYASRDQDNATGTPNEGQIGQTNVPVATPVIPEPATLVLLGSGLLAAARARRKKA